MGSVQDTARQHGTARPLPVARVPSAPPAPVPATATATATEVSIVVPTRNEAGNVAELVRRVDAALGALSLEVLFVDDSDDDTPDAVLRAAATVPWPVRLLHRPPGERASGLGGAVVTGMAVATAPWVVVMDGDLQHPPEVVTQLLAAATGAGADVAVASRYAGDGSAGGLAGRRRSVVSRASTAFSRLLYPRRLRDVSDPMSGFFVVRRDAVDLAQLRPRGFKILLEVLLRAEPLRAVEVPFAFGPRFSGTSKASLREGARFVDHLLRLRCRLAPGRRATLLRAAGFGAVGVSGIAVNLGLLWLLADPRALHLHYLLAAVLATQGSTAWNFALTDLLVFRHAREGSLLRRGAAFAALNNAALLLRLPVLAVLVSGASVDYLLANALTLLLAFVVRFQVADRFIYRRGVSPMTLTSPTGRATSSAPPVPAPVPSRGDDVAPVPEPAAKRPAVDVVLDLTAPSEAPLARGTRYLPFRYDVGGLVTVGSQVCLKELEYFRAPQLGRDLDIEIRVGAVGTGRTRARARLTRSAGPTTLRFEEHLGRFGANFEVHLGERVQVTVTPLLARSPHVLYTNVLEALLRFVLVQQDRILLHSACVELDGRGVMLSARTDTGKTGTILRLVREQGARFLSDDMTVLAADGTATCFPKPLTISHHTLRAVDPGDLSPAEWRRLKIQSRLHSKEGRQWGLLLGELNVPLMTLNALTQWVVPPPKYSVDRLVPAEVISSVRVRDLFIIERGPAGLSEVPDAQALQELVENTDDAYGFPPFRYFAPALVLGRDDYDALRARETAILTSALSRVHVRRLASDAFTWADDIPALLRTEAADRLGDAERTAQTAQL